MERWLYEEYEGMEEDIINFLTALQEKIQNERYRNESVSSQEILALAKLNALIHAGKLSATFENVVLLMLRNARSERWYELLEMSDVKELIQVALEAAQNRSPNSGVVYEYKHLLNVLDTLESMGFKPQEVLSLADNKSKGRESAFPIRQVINLDLPEEEKQRIISEIIEDVANPDVTVQEFRKKNKTRIYNIEIKRIPGHLILLDENRNVLIIYADNRDFETIRFMLESKVDISVTDGFTTVRDLFNMITKGKGDKQRRVIIKNGQIVNSPDGAYLPSRDEFNKLVMQRISDCHDLAEKLSEYEDVTVSLINLDIEYEHFDIIREYYGIPLDAQLLKYNLVATNNGGKIALGLRKRKKSS